MKLNKVLSAFSLMFLAAVGLSSCNTNVPDGPTPGKPDKGDTTETVVPAGDTLSVADIIAMKEAGTLPAKNEGTVKYYVKGYIVGVYDFSADTKFAIGGTTSVNTSLLIADDPECTDTYAVASVKLASGTVYQEKLNLVDNPDNLKKAVLLHGVVEAYCGIGGVVSLDEAYLDGEKVISGSDIDPNSIDYQDGEMSVSDFVAVAEIQNLASGSTTTTEYTVRGVVSSEPSVNLSYGNATFYISDGTEEFYCYQTFNVDGAKFVSGEQIKKGDIVTVKGTVTNHNGTKEFKQASIVRTTNTFDPSSITIEEITIAKALEIGATLASGETTSSQYKIQGSISEVEEASTKYGNITMTIQDEAKTSSLKCHRVYYLDNAKYTEEDPAIGAGDVVTVIGLIQNYSGTIELVNGYISEHIGNE